LSNNKLTVLPQSLSNMKELFTINFSGNQLTSLFPLEGLCKLAVLDVSRNNFSQLPEDLGNNQLENLSQINASFNKLVELSEKLVELPSLKLLNLENNLLTQIPNNLSQAVKLKDLLLKENKLKDNRLKKLVDQDKGKAIIEYLERLYIEESKNKKSKKPANVNVSLIAQKKLKKAADQCTEFDRINVLHFNNNQSNPVIAHNKIVIDESVQEIRPHVICCICRDLDLETPGNFKKFLSIQTKIQDESCEKRTLATIATHDISKLKGDCLFYEAKNPDHIQFVPLGRKYPITAMEFYEKLSDEAEAERKQKKRNQLSGIYKYLSLAESHKSKFPFIRDNLGNVISLPPLTNSEDTKMSTTTKNILVEITSSQSIEICKKVIEELFVEMLNNGIASKQLDINSNTEELTSKVEELDLKNEDAEAEEASSKKLRHTLVLQQVKIVDTKGALKNVYPSRVDLTFGDSKKFEVQRLYED